MTKSELLGTNVTGPQAIYLLGKVWDLLTTMDSYLDFKTEWVVGDLGITDIADVNRVLLGLAEWLDEMDATLPDVEPR